MFEDFNRPESDMNYYEERKLLKLTEENNMMLRALLSMVKEDSNNDFMQNIVANLFANGFERRRR